MKKLLLVAALLCSHSVFASDLLTKVESPVFKTQGSPEQITKKAKVCMASNFLSDSGGNSASSSPFSLVTDEQIIATSRIEYVYRLLRWSVKSKMTFEAREGRFKMINTDIGTKLVNNATLAWGASTNNNANHDPIYKGWGTGSDEVEAQLHLLHTKIADCVMNTSKEEW